MQTEKTSVATDNIWAEIKVQAIQEITPDDIDRIIEHLTLWKKWIEITPVKTSGFPQLVRMKG